MQIWWLIQSLSQGLAQDIIHASESWGSNLRSQLCWLINPFQVTFLHSLLSKTPFFRESHSNVNLHHRFCSAGTSSDRNSPLSAANQRCQLMDSRTVVTMHIKGRWWRQHESIIVTPFCKESFKLSAEGRGERVLWPAKLVSQMMLHFKDEKSES